MTPVSATFSDTPTNVLTIKAAHNNAIVMIRVPRTISFDQLRQRLYDKFVKQEGVLLSDSFTLAHILPSTSDKGRSPHNTAPSTKVSAVTEMYLITSQREWEQAAFNTAYMDKVTLRVLDTPS